MNKNANLIFEEYEDLYKLTGKTVDEHIEFYKKKESLSEENLFTIWKKLSQQAEPPRFTREYMLGCRK